MTEQDENMKNNLSGERLARLETNVENIKDTQHSNHALILAKLEKIDKKINTNMDYIDNNYVAKKEFEPVQNWINNFKKNVMSVLVIVAGAIIVAILGVRYGG